MIIFLLFISLTYYSLILSQLYNKRAQSRNIFIANYKDFQLRDWINQIMARLSSETYNISNPLPSYITDTPLKCTTNITLIPINILILGDSISRNMIDDYCRHNYNISTNPWGKGFYYFRAHASATCQVNDMRISFMNIYGSKKVGPYFHGHTKTYYDRFANTKDRIPQVPYYCYVYIPILEYYTPSNLLIPVIIMTLTYVYAGYTAIHTIIRQARLYTVSYRGVGHERIFI